VVVRTEAEVVSGFDGASVFLLEEAGLLEEAALLVVTAFVSEVFDCSCETGSVSNAVSVLKVVPEYETDTAAEDTAEVTAEVVSRSA
jgi:hypothetical protein